MAEVQKKPVKIVETVLRDAHQSLLATRMTTEQMLPIVDKMDKVGYHAVSRFLISFRQSKIRIISIPFAMDFCTKYSTTSSA